MFPQRLPNRSGFLGEAELLETPLSTAFGMIHIQKFKSLPSLEKSGIPRISQFMIVYGHFNLENDW